MIRHALYPSPFSREGNIKTKQDADGVLTSSILLVPTKLFDRGKHPSQSLLISLIVRGGAGLLELYHLAVIVDDHLETQHAKVGAAFLRNALLHQRIELLVQVLELVFDHCLGEDVFLSHHLGGLLRDETLAALHHVPHLSQDLAIYLVGWDMAFEASIVHNVERRFANKRSIDNAIVFIYYKAGE